MTIQLLVDKTSKEYLAAELGCKRNEKYEKYQTSCPHCHNPIMQMAVVTQKDLDLFEEVYNEFIKRHRRK